MKKVFTLAFVLTSVSLFSQSINLSNPSLFISAKPDTGNNTSILGISCTLTNPQEGATVVLMAGTENDKNEAGQTNARFHKDKETLVLLSKQAFYSNGTLRIELPVPAERINKATILTLYVVNAAGELISNKVSVVSSQ